MAGRKKDYVWQDVTLTEDDKASCNYCDAVISKRPIRIKDHLKKCRKNPANRKQDTPESPEMDIPDLIYILFGSERSLRSADVVGLWVCGSVCGSVPIMLYSSSEGFLRVPLSS